MADRLSVGIRSAVGQSRVGRSAAWRSVGDRDAMQHRGGEGRLAREKFAGAPSPQKKPISLF